MFKYKQRVLQQIMEVVTNGNLKAQFNHSIPEAGKHLAVNIEEFNYQFPHYKLVGKLIFNGGCIDKLLPYTEADVEVC